jgi:IS5 family transposase
VLRLEAGQVDTLWDVLLPDPARLLPDDLARLDQVLASSELLAPFRAHWEREGAERKRSLIEVGRPTIPMATYLRLMAVKQRTGWGYESLVREVADSLHLRRFCLIPLGARVPDESTLRKLTRRLGPEVVDQLIRELIKIAARERRFVARAMRCDSTVIEADVRYPTDAQLAGDAVRTLARIGRQVRASVPGVTRCVRDRSRAVGQRLRELGRTLRRRTGQAKAEVERLTREAAAQAEISVKEARRLLADAKEACAWARDKASRAGLRATQRLERLIPLAERVIEQVRQRFAGEKISDRLISLFDADARPVRRGKLGVPTEFGYVTQLTELTPNTKRGARGLILPPKLQAGSTHDNTLLPQTVQELIDLQLVPKEAAFDGGFGVHATAEAMGKLNTDVFIAGSGKMPSSQSTQRRLASYRVGCEGRISHLKRSYGARRSRLKGKDGARIWTGWTVLAYNLDTVTRMQPKSGAT